ncbi:MAG: hypothetical protein KatS3mg117_0269 [Geminicoccaceae bacterium]|nr:MAG: hypothetical protein KatS3mg117_0269 [Geminicoccaceae bacterium]
MLGHAAAALERIRNIGRRFRFGWSTEPSCRNPEQLAALLAGEAAFVVQKSTLEYCRARAGCSWTKLFETDELVTALRRARWTAFPVVLGDLAEAGQILLRRAGFEEAASAARLRPVVAGALRHHGEPEIPLDLDAAERTILDRLERAAQAPTRSVRAFGPATGRVIFELLPLKTDTRGDREVVQNQVAFLLCGAYARLEERVATAPLAEALLAEAVGGPAGFEPATRPL